MYRYLITNQTGFIQQIMTYLTHGYWFYGQGKIPDHKDPTKIDRKLLGVYDVDISRWGTC